MKLTRARVSKMSESELRAFIAANPHESLRYLVQVVSPSVERRMDAMFGSLPELRKVAPKEARPRRTKKA